MQKFLAFDICNQINIFGKEMIKIETRKIRPAEQGSHYSLIYIHISDYRINKSELTIHGK